MWHEDRRVGISVGVRGCPNNRGGKQNKVAASDPGICTRTCTDYILMGPP